MSDTTVFLKNYQPPCFAVESIYLEVDLYDNNTLVTNQMRLKRWHQGPLHLYGDELELISLHVNGMPVDSYRFEQDDLYLDDCPDEFTITIVTNIYPQTNTKLSGLYRSNTLFCTQCEAEGFRRITFFPDRPDVLTLFTTKITANKQAYPTLLSNGNLIDSGDSADGRHWVIWQDPFKKPSYLFALVAGNLVCVRDKFITCSGKTVDLMIYVEPGNEDKCAHAMLSLKKSMRWDEEVYGREYDLSIFMIVAVSDFNMGAMENKGLNIFNSKYILARPDTATDQDFADIEGVVAHEYFHNWTGNRVTCRDWFQLSLKEGLTVFRDQEFSRDMNSRDVNRIMDVKLLRASQFPEDASRMAHPVRPESYQEINNFYTATIYNKGAEVIRMQHTLLGDKGFRQGMDLYFARHDGQAVTIDDFVAAMEDANAVDFTQLKRWYSQAGTPVVSVSSEWQQHTLTITMTQSCPLTPDGLPKKPFLIPIRIALFNQKGQLLPLERDVLELSEPTQTFRFESLDAKPIVSLLRDFSAPIILHYPQNSDDRLALLRFETNGYAKWQAAQSLALECLHSFLKTPAIEWHIPEVLIHAFRQIVADESLDMALKAELLTPPSFEEVLAGLTDVDVVAIEIARDYYRAELGLALFSELQTIYQHLWAIENNGMDGVAFGQRKFRNVCLWFMMKANEAKVINECWTQFSTIGTMTDKIASFALLVNANNTHYREQAIHDFYTQWSDNDLVMDKWFAIQASSEVAGALARVKALLERPDFSMTNPNRVRSLIGAFSQNNPRHFNAIDGSGYAFLGDMLITMDAINPQIAARLATPFTRWQRLDTLRQALMQAQLTRLIALELSPDLSEVVSKSLAD